MLIAQLSDTHIRAGEAFAYGRVDTASFLRAAIEQLNTMTPKPDAVVITGDLVDYGTSEEYECFAAILAALELPWWPLAGNHDGDALWSVLGSLCPFPLQPEPGYCFKLGELSVLMLSTRVPGQSAGALTDIHLRWLNQALTDASPGPAMLFMHHPPFETGIGHMDAIGCAGTEGLAKLLTRYSNLLAIGCGHLHRMIVSQIGRIPVMTAPSPAHAVALDLNVDEPGGFRFEPPGMLLHRLTPDHSGRLRHVAHQVFIGQFDGPYPFFTASGELVK